MSEQIDSALAWATAQMAPCSESPRLDAELLLAHCLCKPRSYLYTWPDKTLDTDCRHRFAQLVQQRLAPTPVAYLLGRREFYSLEFTASPAALVPRPETELLVELALARIPQDQAFRILDLGTGSGVIAITLKVHRPEAEVVASDIDPACIELARNNAQTHGAEIDFIVSNWFASIPHRPAFDLIVSNPPYIAAGHPFLVAGDLAAEPELALTPGRTGLEALELLIRSSPSYLKSGGQIIVEHGYDQQAAVAALFETHAFTEVDCAQDANGMPRTSSAKLIENPQGSA